MLRLAHRAHERTGSRRLCMAGGVALNCVANGKILREGPFREVWIQPAAGDAGGALGAALLVWHQVLGIQRDNRGRDSMRGALLGPAYSDAEVQAFLAAQGIRSEPLPEDELLGRVAGMLAEGKVVGWFDGRMEFGPRALGARSIIGDARDPRIQAVMNLKIKFRESFRPFAPCVLREFAQEYFDLEGESPYMLLVAEVAKRQRVGLDGSGGLWGIEQLNQVRSTIPAVTHVDYSARVQTVDEERHGRFYRMMRRFYELTGCPVIVNTSFNVRGEPIVCTPADAHRCFRATNIDALALGSHLLVKNGEGQPSEAESYVAQFELD
jgi:carbamoyltransferase